MFQFKQFSVDQNGCAMKINTDGVLLGALADADDPQTILDIGTGTGVIALMQAQRFASAKIDAVEIDYSAAKTAEINFQNSPFAGRLNIYPASIANFFEAYPECKYDLIITNPPFHLNSLNSPETKRSIAKHTRDTFFEELINGVATHLSEKGTCWLILPLQAAELVKKLISTQGMHVQKTIAIYSFEYLPGHREILCFGQNEVLKKEERFVIYSEVNVYSAEYIKLLEPYFIAF